MKHSIYMNSSTKVAFPYAIHFSLLDTGVALCFTIYLFSNHRLIGLGIFLLNLLGNPGLQETNLITRTAEEHV